MKKNFAITATLLSSLLAAGNSLAVGPIQTDSEGDMIYGQGMVAASPSEPFIYTGPVQNEVEGYPLWNLHQSEPTRAFDAPERIADDRDLSTDLIYGS